MPSLMLMLIGIFILPITYCLKCNQIFPKMNTTIQTCDPNPSNPRGGTHCMAYDCAGESLSAGCVWENFCSGLKELDDKCKALKGKKLNCRICNEEDLCIDSDGNIKKSRSNTAGDDTKSSNSSDSLGCAMPMLAIAVVAVLISLFNRFGHI